MSWREEYQRGSFRGVPFRTRDHEASGGRRAVVHEFPGRDDPLVEDLGRRARQFNLELFVVGEEYFAQRDALLAALDEAGPGTLIHPWLGSKQVSVLDWQLSESTEEGGIARFSILFAEAGLPVAASQADGRDMAVDAADAAIAAAPATFAGRFVVEGWPAFVEDAAGDIVTGLAQATQFAAGVGGGVGPALRAFESGLAALGAGGLLRAPLALAHSIVGLVQAVSLLGGSSRRRVAAFALLLAHAPEVLPLPATPARRRQQDNAAALLHLFRVTASAELVRTVAGASFGSQEEAAALRDRIAGQLDTLALAVADAGDEARAADYDGLRRALVRDISGRAPQLSRLHMLRTGATEPALVIANRLYGHALALERAEDMVARNGLPHPGFVPGGSAIMVLSRA